MAEAAFAILFLLKFVGGMNISWYLVFLPICIPLVLLLLLALLELIHRLENRSSSRDN